MNSVGINRLPAVGWLRHWLLLSLIIALCFGKVLYDLARYSATSDLDSHVLLIPFVSAYLIWIKRESLSAAFSAEKSLASVPFVGGIVALAAHWSLSFYGIKPAGGEGLVLPILAFVLFQWAACVFAIGWTAARLAAIPMFLLLFMIPMPAVLRDLMEVFFQHTSAIAALLMLKLTGTPVFQDGLQLRLPGITLVVNQECSGIRSSLVLLITSLVAGEMFLRRGRNRLLLALAIIPLAILRNGFRIFVIAQLCVHLGPEMIDSMIHRRGGPFFFALSLVPLFLLLFALRKSERKRSASQ